MLTQHAPYFDLHCDVCGAMERIEAPNHQAVWDAMKRLAWVVRKDDPLIIHVCPECPANPSPQWREGRL